jgi:hypothetical protein
MKFIVDVFPESDETPDIIQHALEEAIRDIALAGRVQYTPEASDE